MIRNTPTTRRDPGGWRLALGTEAIERHTRSGAWRNKTIADCARELADREPGQISYVADGRGWRIEELLADAQALAASLAARGFRAGDVVSFQLPNWMEVVVLDLAAAMLGLVINPIVPIYRDAELVFMLRDCRAKAIFIPARYRNHDYAAMLRNLAPALPDLELICTVRRDDDLTADAAANSNAANADYETLVAERQLLSGCPPVDANSVKMILYTSGTTGRPKGVLHTHNTAACVLYRAFRHWGQRPGEAVLMASPVTHVTGLGYGVELPLLCGSKTVFMERWNAEEAVGLIEREAVAMSMGATPFLDELLKECERQHKTLPSLRIYACGGAAVPPDLIRKSSRLLENCRAFRVFGSSEAPLVTLGFTRDDQLELAAETDGEIVDYEVRIVDDRGRQLPPGVEGEICVRGPALFCGYADPAQTAESIGPDGYFATGDLGSITPEQAILISGRKKDLINRGGEKISARELEDIVHTHPAIAEAAAIAVPHARLGETVAVCAVLRHGTNLTLEELVDYVAGAGLARQKHPERLFVVDQLPHTASGKVRKDLLRTSYATL